MTRDVTSLPQPMHPHGLVGRMVGGIMNLLNREAQQFALRRLDVKPTDHVLEIGFGPGQLIRMLAAEAPDGLVAGVDPSALMVATARRRNAGAIKRKTVDLRQGTASALHWPDRQFDKAVAIFSFQFWRDPEQDLREVARVLKSGGLLLLVLRARAGDKDYSWLPNPMSRGRGEATATLAALAKAGFEKSALEGKTGKSQVISALRA